MCDARRINGECTGSIAGKQVTEFDLGVLLIAIRNSLPEESVATFEALMRQGAESPTQAPSCALLSGLSPLTSPHRASV